MNPASVWPSGGWPTAFGGGGGTTANATDLGGGGWGMALIGIGWPPAADPAGELAKGGCGSGGRGWPVDEGAGPNTMGGPLGMMRLLSSGAYVAGLTNTGGGDGWPTRRLLLAIQRWRSSAKAQMGSTSGGGGTLAWPDWPVSMAGVVLASAIWLATGGLAALEVVGVGG